MKSQDIEKQEDFFLIPEKKEMVTNDQKNRQIFYFSTITAGCQKLSIQNSLGKLVSSWTKIYPNIWVLNIFISHSPFLRNDHIKE